MSIRYIEFTIQVVNSITNWQPLSPQPETISGVTFRVPVLSISDGIYSSIDDVPNREILYAGNDVSTAISAVNDLYGASIRTSLVTSPRPMQSSNAYTGPVSDDSDAFFNHITAVVPGAHRGIIGINETSALLYTFKDKNNVQFQVARQLNSNDGKLYNADGTTEYTSYPVASVWLAQDYSYSSGTAHWYVFDNISGRVATVSPKGSYLTGRIDSGSATESGNVYAPAILRYTYSPDDPKSKFLSRFFDIVTADKSRDPFQGGGYSSGHVGGGGDFDTSSDPIPVPDLPPSDVLTSGMFRLYNPTAEQLKSFADYLWSENFVVDNIKKLFSDPMQSILGLSIIPAQAGPNVSETVSFNGISSGVTMPRVTYQYVTVDCGSISVAEFWGAYLDYAPYTSFQLYLPYIGTRPLSVDDVMGGSLGVVYHIDVTTGACVCFVSCGDRVLYTFSGSCATEIPVTASNWSSAIGSAINIAASIGTMVATGGASAPLSVSSMASSVSNMLKPEVEKSGAMSGGAAILGIQYPYLIITRPIQCVPEDQNNYTGYPSFVTVTLGSESGWTVVQSIHLEGVSCTAAEKDEIMQLLTTGVIIA